MTVLSITKLHITVLVIPTLLLECNSWSSFLATTGGRTTYENSQDPGFPWIFRGRAVMRPALVRIDPLKQSEKNVWALSFAGWTIGGTVVLEYDESPVGPYREYVCLGGLALAKNGGRFMVGQYGARLIVSEKRAERLCREVWNLTAEQDAITFIGGGEKLSMSVDQATEDLSVSGWNWVQDSEKESGARLKGLQLLWTPKIKAIWTSLLPLPESEDNNQDLPLHRLRLSGVPRLSFNSFDRSMRACVPLGIDIVFTNALIEISKEI